LGTSFFIVNLAVGVPHSIYYKGNWMFGCLLPFKGGDQY